MLINTAIYVRVSTEEQATEGFSIHAQKDKLTKYAEVSDYNIVDYYIDDGISGKKYITYRCNGHHNNSCNAPGFSHYKLEDSFLKYLDNIKDFKFNKKIMKKEDKLNDKEVNKIKQEIDKLNKSAVIFDKFQEKLDNTLNNRYSLSFVEVATILSGRLYTDSNNILTMLRKYYKLLDEPTYKEVPKLLLDMRNNMLEENSKFERIRTF